MSSVRELAAENAQLHKELNEAREEAEQLQEECREREEEVDEWRDKAKRSVCDGWGTVVQACLPSLLSSAQSAVEASSSSTETALRERAAQVEEKASLLKKAEKELEVLK